MNQAIHTDLDHAAYHQQVKLPKYNCRVNIFQATCPADAARLLRRNNPDWSKEDHLQLAQQHAERSSLEREKHAQLLDAAAMETFGRPFRVTDYRISAIGCEEFSEEKKEALRFSAHAGTTHLICSRAHAKAASARTYRARC